MIKIAYLDFPPMIFGYSELDLKTGMYWIFIDNKQCLLHQRFAFGHELAHVFLKHHNKADYFADHGSAILDNCEREANRRAWEFYRRYKGAFYQLQQVGKATISV